MDIITEQRDELIHELFKKYDEKMTGSLSEEQLREIYSDMRLGGLSLQQVKASIQYVCVGDDCDQEELYDVLHEMDRRYFLIQDLRWEFTMLDYNQTDTITENNAQWFLESVHGRFFSKNEWKRFLSKRAVPGSGVSFAEIEVMLCNVNSIFDLFNEQEEEKRLEEEQARKNHELQHRIMEAKDRMRKQRESDKKLEEEENLRRRTEEDMRRSDEESERLQKQAEKEEQMRRQQQLLDEEERGRREAEKRDQFQKEKEIDEQEKKMELLELQRLKEIEVRVAHEEEKRGKREAEEAMEDEQVLNKAVVDEKDSAEKMVAAKVMADKAKDVRSKKEYEDEVVHQTLRNKEAKTKTIKYQLKVSFKKRDKLKLPKAVKDFRDSKLPDDADDLEKAEKLIKEWAAGDGLRNAMDTRQLKELEAAMNMVRRNGFEPQLAKAMIEANRILLQLKRLERIRAEILELKQSTVAEIRSYSSPPAIVHTIMIATFLLHGHPEKRTKDWRTVQALVGKTGKDGLKRRCLQMEPNKVRMSDAKRAQDLLREYSLDDVRDVSAGAATFYLWCKSMIEECEAKRAKAREATDAS